jgi:hypothetical protein
MQFNLGKCHLLQIGRNPTPHNYTMMSAERWGTSHSYWIRRTGARPWDNDRW